MTEGMISPEMTVNEVIRLYPTTVAVFNAFGVDACCGGAASLEEAAERDGVDVSELLAALREAAEESGGRTR